MPKQKLEWHTEKRHVKDLVLCKNNPNVNTDKQFSNLKKSIKRDGYVETIVIDIDGKIVAGAHRQLALIEMGMADDEIDVRVPNRKLTKEEFDRYLIASNALHGQWDFTKLTAFNIETLLDIGMDENELANIWDAQLEVENDEFSVEKELAKIKKPKTRLGQIIQLGSHKLIAGNATDPAVIKKLFGKEQASMIYLDPVYNLNLDYSRGLGGRQNYGGNVNDHRSDEEYREFLKKIIENALLVAKDDVHVFCYCDQTYIGLIQELYRELGIKNKRVALWIKNGFNPTPGVAFNKCYEPTVYGVRGLPYLTKGIENLNEIQNKELGTGNRLIEEVLDQLDVWLVKRLAGSDYEHCTSKPPNLHEKAIRRCTRVGEIILDSTAGSGSSLIAAEQLKRRAYLCELELNFCDLIINRYVKLTGKKPKYLN